MNKFIIADNQELTRFALESLIRQKGHGEIFSAHDKAGLVQLLKEHEDAVVVLDYTLFDFADENQLLIIAERFALAQWILISEDLTPQFLRSIVYLSNQFSIVFKDGTLRDIRDALEAVSHHNRHISQRVLETILNQQQSASPSTADLPPCNQQAWNIAEYSSTMRTGRYAIGATLTMRKATSDKSEGGLTSASSNFCFVFAPTLSGRLCTRKPLLSSR